MICEGVEWVSIVRNHRHKSRPLEVWQLALSDLILACSSVLIKLFSNFYHMNIKVIMGMMKLNNLELLWGLLLSYQANKHVSQTFSLISLILLLRLSSYILCSETLNLRPFHWLHELTPVLFPFFSKLHKCTFASLHVVKIILCVAENAACPNARFTSEFYMLSLNGL